MKLIKKYLNPSGPIYSTIALPEVEVRPGYPRMPKESDYMSDEELAEAFATPQEYLDAASLRYLLNLYHTDYGKFKQEWERLHPGSTAEGRQAMRDLQALSTMMQHRNLAMDKWKVPLGVLMGGAVAAPLAGTASALGTAFTLALPILSGALKGAGHLFFANLAANHILSDEGFAKTKRKFLENPANFFGNAQAWMPITNGNFSTQGGLLDPNADRGWGGSLGGDLVDLTILGPLLRGANKISNAYAANLTRNFNNLAFKLGDTNTAGWTEIIGNMPAKGEDLPAGHYYIKHPMRPNMAMVFEWDGGPFDRTFLGKPRKVNGMIVSNLPEPKIMPLAELTSNLKSSFVPRPASLRVKEIEDAARKYEWERQGVKWNALDWFSGGPQVRKLTNNSYYTLNDIDTFNKHVLNEYLGLTDELINSGQLTRTPEGWIGKIGGVEKLVDPNEYVVAHSKDFINNGWEWNGDSYFSGMIDDNIAKLRSNGNITLDGDGVWSNTNRRVANNYTNKAAKSENEALVGTVIKPVTLRNTPLRRITGKGSYEQYRINSDADLAGTTLKPGENLNLDIIVDLIGSKEPGVIEFTGPYVDGISRARASNEIKRIEELKTQLEEEVARLRRNKVPEKEIREFIQELTRLIETEEERVNKLFEGTTRRIRNKQVKSLRGNNGNFDKSNLDIFAYNNTNNGLSYT